MNCLPSPLTRLLAPKYKYGHATTAQRNAFSKYDHFKQTDISQSPPTVMAAFEMFTQRLQINELSLSLSQEAGLADNTINTSSITVRNFLPGRSHLFIRPRLFTFIIQRGG